MKAKNERKKARLEAQQKRDEAQERERKRWQQEREREKQAACDAADFLRKHLGANFEAFRSLMAEADAYEFKKAVRQAKPHKRRLSSAHDWRGGNLASQLQAHRGRFNRLLYDCRAIACRFLYIIAGTIVVEEIPHCRRASPSPLCGLSEGGLIRQPNTMCSRCIRESSDNSLVRFRIAFPSVCDLTEKIGEMIPRAHRHDSGERVKQHLSPVIKQRALALSTIYHCCKFNELRSGQECLVARHVPEDQGHVVVVVFT
ncbi:hypothetical protein [Sinorhizobium fredii]|uniref:hypothetical protein n=1 Tax=Rhizobium fredii TaxID=380 RepID=UPI001295E5E3|nr:hypothetical protein [Sinorhizobium fredii]